MSDTNITRRSFLAKAAAMAAVPVIASSLASCADEGNSVASAQDNFDAELNAKETLAVSRLRKTNGPENLTQLPLTAFYEPALEYGIYLVLSKTKADGRPGLQFIQVNMVNSEGTLKTVEGLPANAEIFLNPKTVIADLIGKNRREIKRRFRHIVLFEGGSL